jgi:hypothetical protein
MRRRGLALLLTIAALCCAASPAGAGQRLAAEVAGMPITEAAFVHWFRIAARSQGHGRGTHLIPHRFSPRWKQLRDQVMQFLISGKWIVGEAQRQGIAVSDAAVGREFARIRDQSFSTRRAFVRFLRDSGMNRVDVRYRVRLDVLSNRIRRKVVAGATTAAEQQQALDKFVAEFRHRWLAQTRCRPAYRTTDCAGTL